MFGWDRNPLRRRIDRVEGGMIAGLILIFVIAAPVLATVTGNWTRGSLTGPPLRHAQPQGRIAVAEMLAVCVLGLVLFLVGGTGRFLLRRRRLAGWGTAWRAWCHRGPSSAK